MKSTRVLMIASLAIVGFTGASGAAQAQTAARSTATIPAAIREEIDRLASDDAGRRATAAATLGKLGAAAEPAIPWLMAAMSDERRVLSLEGGERELYAVVGVALAQIGLPAMKHAISLLSSPSTSSDMRRNAARALTMMRDSDSLDLVLGAVPIAYGESDHNGGFGNAFGDVLPCFLPDPRVLDAYLRLQAAEPVGLNPGRNFLFLFRRDVPSLPRQVTTLEATQEWWARNRATASIGTAPASGLCRK